MSVEQRKENLADRDLRGPYRVHLPRFVSDDEVGLGDVIKRATTIVGITPCGGCAQRAVYLNNLFVFSKRR